MPATQTEGVGSCGGGGGRVGVGVEGGAGCHVGFKRTQKGARRFRANAAKPANLAGVWG